MNADVSGLVAQARFLISQSRDDEAKVCLERATRLAPDCEEAHYLLGQLLREAGRLDSAVSRYLQTLEINPGHREARFSLGTAYADLGKIDDALRELRELLGIPEYYPGRLPQVDDPDIAGNGEAREVLVATSLAPKDIENQRNALASWRRAGFRVLVINSREEIGFLEPYFPELEFVVADRDAKASFGKPFVYFDDILSCLDQQGSRICGIVNADIHFPQEHIAQFMLEEADGAFVYGCRVDVPDLSASGGELYELGFDYFFFDRKYLHIYPPEDFCMGLPWWDFWAVLIPVLRGMPVKKLVSPIAYHLAHPVNWDEKSWLSLGGIAAKYMGASIQPTLSTRHHYLAYILLLLKHASEPVLMHPA